MKIKTLTEFITEANKVAKEIGDLKDQVISAMKDKGVPATAMSIKTALGGAVTVAQVNNILKGLEDGGHIVKNNILGHDKFEFIQKFEGNQPGYSLDQLNDTKAKGPAIAKPVLGISKTINDLQSEGPKGLNTLGKTKGISKDINEIGNDVLHVMKDKGVKMSSYTIAGHVGFSEADVNNVLTDLQAKGKIVKTTWGRDNFWFMQKF